MPFRNHNLVVSQAAALAAARVRMAWARVRRSRWQAALWILMMLVSGYMMWTSGLAGLAAGMLAARRANSWTLVSRILLATSCLSVAASLVWGPEAQGAFSDRVLRHYPLSATWRGILFHFHRLCTPIWMIAGIFLVTLLAAFAVVHNTPLADGILLAGGILLWSYQGSLLLQHTIEFCLRRPLRSLSFLGILGVALAILHGIAESRTNHLLSTVAAAVNSALPTTLAARGIYRGSFQAVLWVACWVMAELPLLRLLSKGRFRPKATRGRLLPSLVRILPFGDQPISIMSVKSLRYQLTCNRMRMGFVLSPIVLLIFVWWLGPRVTANGTPYGALAACFVMALFITRPMTLNHLGYDGPGLRRYRIFPMRFSWFVLADAIVATALGIAIGILGAGAIFAEGFMPANLDTFILAALALLSGAIFFNAAGMITSVLSPRKMELARIVGNDMSFGGMITLYAGFAIPIFLAFWVSQYISFSAIESKWWMGIGALGICCLWSWYVWEWVDRQIEKRKDRLVSVLR